MLSKPSKLIDFAKPRKFSNKLSGFRVFNIKFAAKRYKILSDFVKNHENSSIWPNPAGFQSTYHDLGFSPSSVQEKVEITVWCCRKPSKLIHLAKTSRFSNKLSSFSVFSIKCAAKSCKMSHFFKNHQKLSIWPKLAWLQFFIAQKWYPQLFTDPEGDSCFHLYLIRWIKKYCFINGHNFFLWNFRETTRHFILRSQNSEYPKIFQVTGANQNARKLLSTDLVRREGASLG